MSGPANLLQSGHCSEPIHSDYSCQKVFQRLLEFDDPP